MLAIKVLPLKGESSELKKKNCTLRLLISKVKMNLLSMKL